MRQLAVFLEPERSWRFQVSRPGWDILGELRRCGVLRWRSWSDIAVHDKKHVFVHWVSGFVLSVLVIWLVGALILPLPDLWEYDESLGMVVHAPHTIQTDRTEGWGETRFGAHGAQGLTTVPAGAQPHVCFLGDSYVQGGQVDLREHFYNLYNRAVSDGDYAVAYGFSGRDCSIYFELMKGLPRVFPDIRTYVVFLGVDDIVPNGTSQILNPPQFIYRPRPRPLLQYRDELYRIRANFAWMLLKLAKESAETFRIRPGPVTEQHVPTVRSRYAKSEAAYAAFWRALVKSALDAAGDRELVIVVKEMLPEVEAGQIERQVDNAQMLDRFVRIARQSNVTVLDMRRVSLRHYEDTGEFAKGFICTYPGEGHWNEVGHRLVAETMESWLSQDGVDSADEREGRE